MNLQRSVPRWYRRMNGSRHKQVYRAALPKLERHARSDGRTLRPPVVLLEESLESAEPAGVSRWVGTYTSQISEEHDEFRPDLGSRPSTIPLTFDRLVFRCCHNHRDKTKLIGPITWTTSNEIEHIRTPRLHQYLLDFGRLTCAAINFSNALLSIFDFASCSALKSLTKLALETGRLSIMRCVVLDSGP